MLLGLITDRHRDQIEAEFPGIWRFYLDLTEKPNTFLDLVWRYDGGGGGDGRCAAVASGAAIDRLGAPSHEPPN